MPGQMKGRIRDGRKRGKLSARENQLMRMVGTGMTAPALQPKGRISEQEMRRLIEAMTSQSPPPIRGMNSQTRIDMLKNPKFRK